jgi:hypothetical protein
MSGETQVDRGSLPGQAIVWGDQSSTMADITATIGGAQVGSVLSLFADAVNAYNKAAAEYGKLSGQGQAQMADISAALVTAAQRYDGLEQQMTQASNSATNPGH